jgi:uncharacterized short protein YbdD (DUF466 family)
MSAHVHPCDHGCGHAAPASAAGRDVAAKAIPRRKPWWRQVIAYLRRWSGDDAYERYLAEHQGHGHAPLSRREFYRRYLDRRAGGSRCC